MMQRHRRALLSLLCILFFQASTSFGADLDMSFETGLDVLRSCKAALDDSPVSDPEEAVLRIARSSLCSGYLGGMIDMNVVYKELVMSQLAPDSGFFCPPSEGFQTEQGIRIVVKYLESHPEELHQGKRVLVIQAFGKAFPCKGNKSTTPKSP